MENLFERNGRELRSPFFGFSVELPNHWGADPPKILRSQATYSFRPVSGDAILNIHIYTQTYKGAARYFEDEEYRKKVYPEIAALPFGEAFSAARRRRSSVYS